MKPKNLWKNINWINLEEKEAFFHKYFNSKDRTFVQEEVDKRLKNYKKELIDFIETDIVNKDKSKRRPTPQEIIQRIQGR